MDVQAKILAIISQQSYITIEQLMEIALSSQDASYYRSSQVIGQKHDFITAPEISAMFGEMIAIWAILQWQALGGGWVNLVELGPGRGTLMRDLLRTVRQAAPDFFCSIKKIMLLEINPHLISLQNIQLESFGIPIVHIKDYRALDNTQSIIIANEFFDALPIQQYKKLASKWHSVVVKYDK